MTVNVI